MLDVDGTLLDSATGIVAGFVHALRSVGFEPPDEATLRGDVGPPVDQIFTRLGLPAPDLAAAVLAYRTYYLAYGLQQSRPYAGVTELLVGLRSAGVRLGTATAKRTDVARAILDHHGLTDYFEVVNGTDDHHRTKTEILRHTLELLGSPAPVTAAMVGDRASDIVAARDCGVHPVAVTWGYGSLAELRSTEALLVSQPADLLRLPLL